MDEAEAVQACRDTVQEVVVARDPGVQKMFLDRFGSEVQKFVSVAGDTYYELLQMPNHKVPENYRTAWAEHYLFMALNSLVVAFRLLMSGLPIPAGNQARQFGESVAMSLLLSSDELGEFQRFEMDPAKYPVHKAIDRANKKKTRKILDLNPEGWGRLMEIQKFFDQLSHASAFSSATTQDLSVSGQRFLGAGFDEDKGDFYSLQITLLTSACERLQEVFPLVEDFLRATRKPA